VVVRFDDGEEVISGISEICMKENIHSGVILSFVGALKKCEFVFREGCQRSFQEHFEVCGNGNITNMNDTIKIHLHLVAGNDLNVKVGHLVMGVVTIFCELVIQKLEGFRMTRTLDKNLDNKMILFPYRLDP
jgi:predicted DNA-binding protein with PD1-like motif